MKKIRVLVFGATGTGKTSLCNALTGGSRPTDSGARGITAKSHLYAPFEYRGVTIELVDTVGLHESAHGTVPADQAVVALIELLENARDGFSLLIHVARASRITKEHDDDFTLFVLKMTQRAVPVVLAATGCENHEPMDAWVDGNRDAFRRFQYADLVATCFASGGQLEDRYAPLREQSRARLLESVRIHALAEPKKIFGPGTGTSVDDVFNRVWNELVTLFGLPDKYRRRVNESAYALLKRLGVPQAIAEAAVKHLPDLFEEIGDKLPVPAAGKGLRKLSEFLLTLLTRKVKGS